MPENGETAEESRERAFRISMVVDHEGHMLPEMVKPETVGLRWMKNARLGGARSI
jgi:hypothetical protein